jgi:hypothetical protein
MSDCFTLLMSHMLNLFYIGLKVKNQKMYIVLLPTDSYSTSIVSVLHRSMNRIPQFLFSSHNLHFFSSSPALSSGLNVFQYLAKP